MKQKQGFGRSALAASLLLATLLLSLVPTHSVKAQTQQGTTVLPISKFNRKTKSSSGLRAAMASKTSSSTPVKANSVATAKAGDSMYLAISTEFSTPAARQAMFTETKTSKIKDIYVITAIDRFADLYIATNEAYNRLLVTPGLVWAEALATVYPPPPPTAAPSTVPSRAVPERIVRGGYGSLKGKNVIIAIVDTGVDFRHPDFIRYGALGIPSSRLLYLWDTYNEYAPGVGSEAPLKYPNGTSVGTLYTQEQLTRELRSTTSSIPATDLNGHGTACASVAAGNGNNDFRSTDGLKRTDVVGVAPDADIIAISMGPDLSNYYLLNEFAEWLNTVAGAKSLVISGSFGGHASGHDGNTILERQLNARFPLNKVGRAILFSAGNDGSRTIHASSMLGPQASAKWINWDSDSRDVPLLIYFSGANISDVMIEVPNGQVFRFDESEVTVSPLTHQASYRLPVPEGSARIKLFTSTGRSMRTDLYFYYGAEFDSLSADYSGVVGNPGSMANAITVGSYDWNDNFNLSVNGGVLLGVCLGTDGRRIPIEIGSISCYSSPGPTRDNRLKPEIGSPGEWYTSAASKPEGLALSSNWSVDVTGNYVAMNGTSAATPYAAGIVALMFEKKPTLTLGDVKNLLRSNASTDPFTGTPPEGRWGSGKLDMAAVARIFAGL